MSSSFAAFSSPKSPIGRVAVVTGSNKGIGFFIALQLGLSNLFSHIIVACRDPTRGQSAVAQLKQQQQVASAADTRPVSFRYLPLTLGDHQSHMEFRKRLEDEFGRLDVLVNNAAMAYKGADPTPFVDQCRPTLDVNFHGTVDFTEQLLPLLTNGKNEDARIVNVASMSGRLSQITSKPLRDKFTSKSLTMSKLQELVEEFQRDVQEGVHKEHGWGNSNYGMSKLAVIAATKVWAHENPSISVNCCCPGYCATDMSSQRGTRHPQDGAKNAVIPATMENPPTGQFFADYQVSEW